MGNQQVVSRQAFPVHTVVTHRRQHLDEYAALWALRRWGTACYPGIEGAEVVEFDPAAYLDGRSETEWMGDGYLFVGVGGGRYDDHPHDRFPNDCAFTLVLHDLGVNADPALNELKRHILYEDKNGGAHPLHIALVIKQLHRVAGEADIDRFAMLSFEALYLQQTSFQEALRVVLDPGCQKTAQNRSSGDALKLVVVENNDNEDVSRAARSKDGPNAALVLHRSTWGSTYIAGSTRLGTRDLTSLVECLRQGELTARGETTAVDRSLLRSEGTITDDEGVWYFLHGGNTGAGQIFNRSLTTPGAPQTKLTTEQITEHCIGFLRSVRLDPRSGGKGNPPPQQKPDPGRQQQHGQQQR